MTRRHLTLAPLLLLLVLGLALAGCGGDDDESSGTTAAETTGGADTSASAGGGATLNGSVGPGFDISLDGTDGITAGDYTLVVNDQSSAHNFHLTGPGGVDVSTDVSAEGEKTFDVTLVPGEYKFQCDPHASSMNGSFTVG
ncbi:MAG TPA: plastocyanin/azurin family copper-binding protein [Solirubrobacterales bacterium]|nr:plastocyanin/azurin family copper-binding protein [Solirubrobacterales bacterium]